MPTKTRSPKKRPPAKRVAVKSKATAVQSSARSKRKQPETLRVRTMTPLLTVNNIADSLRFYTEGLGFVVKERWEQDGKLGGVTLEAGRCQLMLNQDDFAKGRDRVKGVGHRVWLSTVQKVDDLAARAKAAGIRLDHDVEDQPWGARAFALTDPDGFKLTVSNEK